MKHSSIYQAIILLILISSSFSSCTNDKLEDHRLPPEEAFYLFNLGSKVDAKFLGCGYEAYEDCGDRVKKRIRQEVGTPSFDRLVELGQHFHENFIPFPVTSHSRENWVVEIVNKMKPFMLRQEYPYEVYILESDQFNAFTIPGGNIYVTTKVLDLVQNIHELAYIVGHELAHNENDHTKENARLYMFQLKKEEEDNIFSSLNSLFTTYVSSSCGKSDELECDISSMYLLDEAGYDAELALGGIEILRQISGTKSNNFWDGLFFSLFGTHPWSDDRVNCVQGYVRGSKVNTRCEEVFTDLQGVVNTKTSPLGLREYPIKKSNKIFDIPKGSMVDVICDCVEQEYRKNIDFYYVSFLTADNTLLKGWVDKQYIQLVSQ